MLDSFRSLLLETHQVPIEMLTLLVTLINIHQYTSIFVEYGHLEGLRLSLHMTIGPESETAVRIDAVLNLL